MVYIGKSIPQLDSFLKVNGTATYAFDIELPGMLYAKLVTSPHAHARIMKIDTSQAESIPGVVAVATGSEFPYRLGIYVGDRDVLAVDKVRWVGHPVAAVVAETLEAAEQAIDQVEVDYEPLPTLFDPLEALKPDAPVIHEKMSEYRVSPAFKPIPGTNIANQFKLVRGDVERGFQECDAIIEGEFDIPHVTHGFMELQSVIAEYKKDGLEQLKTFHQAMLQAPPQILEQEKGFELPLANDVILTGRMDQVNSLGRRDVEIVDYKTGKPKKEADARKDLQLSIYALAAKEIFEWNPVRLAFHYLQNNQVQLTTRDAKQLDDAEKIIQETAADIRAGEFPAKIVFACRRCAYKPICPAHEEALTGSGG
jgi:CRISPR/Cas system-associated exonuclease Cas4 (RecB family)